MDVLTTGKSLCDLVWFDCSIMLTRTVKRVLKIDCSSGFDAALGCFRLAHLAAKRVLQIAAQHCF